jgi:hypothetical protein
MRRMMIAHLKDKSMMMKITLKVMRKGGYMIIVISK